MPHRSFYHKTRKRGYTIKSNSFMDRVLFCSACGAFRPLVYRASSGGGVDAGDETTAAEGAATGADIDGDAVTCSQCGCTSKFLVLIFPCQSLNKVLLSTI